MTVLSVFAYFIGAIIGLVLIFSVKSVIDKLPEFYTKRLIKKLSPDKPAEAYGIGYIIYNNNSRWYFENWVGVTLLWIPENQLGELTLEEAIANKFYLEYEANWLPEWITIWSVKWIIKNHPNLKK